MHFNARHNLNYWQMDEWMDGPTVGNSNSYVTPYYKQVWHWATSWENLFNPYANNKDTDQPAHPHSLISAFVRSLNSMIPTLVNPNFNTS